MTGGLAELLEDDRATLLGGFYSLCDPLKGLDGNPKTVKLRWRRRGLRAFDEDAGAVQEKMGDRKESESGSSRSPGMGIRKLPAWS